jgi:hypothetical protein
VRRKLHASTAAHGTFQQTMLAAIGLGDGARRTAASTTSYGDGTAESFTSGDQTTLASPVLARHVALLSDQNQEALTADLPELVEVATDTDDVLVDDAGNMLVGWV